MKLLSCSAFSLLLSLSPLAASPPDSKGARITRNEAEHIALQQYPGARVTAAKLVTAGENLVWSIEIAPPNAKAVAIVVDAQTGRVVPAKKESR